MITNQRKIKAVLHPNKLKNNEGTYKAQIIPHQTVNVEDICSLINSSDNAGDKSQLDAWKINLFLKQMVNLLANGYIVNTGYFTARVNIKGSFRSKGEKFNPDKHSVTFKFTQGHISREMLQDIHVEIESNNSANSGIDQVRDTTSNSLNELLTPGRNLEIKGTKLKLIGNPSEIGLYFINQQTGEQTKVPEVDIVINENNHLLIMTPDLVPGTYHIMHVTQYAGNSVLLNTPRTNTFAATLVVR